MTDQELLEWYKGGAGKTDDMSDKDYELYKSKALTAQGNQLLSDNLAAQQGAVAKAQTSAQQSASIANDKLMRYLGVRNAEAGIGSLQTGSDAIQANNNYVQNRAAIANNAAQQNIDLLNQYASNKHQNEVDAFNKEQSVMDKYYGREYQEGRDKISDDRYNTEWNYGVEQDEYNKTKEQNAADYEHASAMLDNYLSNYMADGEISDAELAEAEKYLSQYGNLPASEQKKLRELIDYYRSDSYKSNTEAQKMNSLLTNGYSFQGEAVHGGGRLDGNYTAEALDANFIDQMRWIQSRQGNKKIQGLDEALSAIDSGKVKNGEIFSINGEYAMYYDGRIYKLNKQ